MQLIFEHISDLGNLNPLKVNFFEVKQAGEGGPTGAFLLSF